jgi:hypothetical protein
MKASTLEWIKKAEEDWETAPRYPHCFWSTSLIDQSGVYFRIDQSSEIRNE